MVMEPSTLPVGESDDSRACSNSTSPSSQQMAYSNDPQLLSPEVRGLFPALSSGSSSTGDVEHLQYNFEVQAGPSCEYPRPDIESIATLSSGILDDFSKREYQDFSSSPYFRPKSSMTTSSNNMTADRFGNTTIPSLRGHNAQQFGHGAQASIPLLQAHNTSFAHNGATASAQLTGNRVVGHSTKIDNSFGLNSAAVAIQGGAAHLPQNGQYVPPSSRTPSNQPTTIYPPPPSFNYNRPNVNNEISDVWSTQPLSTVNNNITQVSIDRHSMPNTLTYQPHGHATAPEGIDHLVPHFFVYDAAGNLIPLFSPPEFLSQMPMGNQGETIVSAQQAGQPASHGKRSAKQAGHGGHTIGTKHPEDAYRSGHSQKTGTKTKNPGGGPALASVGIQRYATTSSSVTSVLRTNGVRAPIQLQFNSPDQARPHVNRRIPLRKDDETFQSVKDNMPLWVVCIMNSVMHTGYIGPPTHKPNLVEQLNDSHRDYWNRWQQEEAEEVANLLRLENGVVNNVDIVREVEARAWLIVEEFIKVGEDGYILCALTEEKNMPCVKRLQLAVKLIDAYAILRTDILDDFKVKEFAASPEAYVQRKIQNLWVNYKKKPKKVAEDETEETGSKKKKLARWDTAAYKKRLTNSERLNMHKAAIGEVEAGQKPKKRTRKSLSDGPSSDVEDDVEDGGVNPYLQSGIPVDRGYLQPATGATTASYSGQVPAFADHIAETGYSDLPYPGVTGNKHTEKSPPRRSLRPKQESRRALENFPVDQRFLYRSPEDDDTEESDDFDDTEPPEPVKKKPRRGARKSKQFEDEDVE